MSSEIKSMSLKEFRELGFIQELNREFLHPLGLALGVRVDNDTGEVTFDRIWDYRDDPEGIIFDDSVINTREARQKNMNVSKEWEKHRAAREKLFNGSVTQPLGKGN